MQSFPNDIRIRNMSPIAIWSLFAKLETDVSKAQYVFTEHVFVSMYGGLINNGQELGVRSLPVSVTAVSEQ